MAACALLLGTGAGGEAVSASGVAELPTAAMGEGENILPTAAVDGEWLVPVGKTVGIKLFADGVMVIELSEIKTGDGSISPAKQAGLRVGDVITKVEAEPVTSAEQFVAAIAASGGRELSLSYVRGGVDRRTTVQPVCGEQGGDYRMGAWIRDSMAGIGTVTFYDPDSGVFGALGHGVNDVDTAVLMPMQSGSVMASEVVAVKKGLSGAPGELRGSFDLGGDLGSLYANTGAGVFGVLGDSETFAGEALPVAVRSEAEPGPATILANVAGETVEEYAVEILRVDVSGENPVRNLLLRVTDSRLLETTGGIVQGMSGSPILQNGKLIGAVTHVLVNDPQLGYGIFIDNMLAAAEQRADATA